MPVGRILSGTKPKHRKEDSDGEQCAGRPPRSRTSDNVTKM